MRKSMRARQGSSSQQRGGGARNRHRTVLVAAVVVGCAGLFSGVSASTGGDDELQEVDAATSTEQQPEANALSRGAPDGALTLPALPVQVSRPQPATPAVITGLADNGIPNVALNAYRVAATRMNASDPGCGID